MSLTNVPLFPQFLVINKKWFITLDTWAKFLYASGQIVLQLYFIALKIKSHPPHPLKLFFRAASYWPFMKMTSVALWKGEKKVLAQKYKMQNHELLTMFFKLKNTEVIHWTWLKINAYTLNAYKLEFLLPEDICKSCIVEWKLGKLYPSEPLASWLKCWSIGYIFSFMLCPQFELI